MSEVKTDRWRGTKISNLEFGLICQYMITFWYQYENNKKYFRPSNN